MRKLSPLRTSATRIAPLLLLLPTQIHLTEGLSSRQTNHHTSTINRNYNKNKNVISSNIHGMKHPNLHSNLSILPRQSHNSDSYLTLDATNPRESNEGDKNRYTSASLNASVSNDSSTSDTAIKNKSSAGTLLGIFSTLSVSTILLAKLNLIGDYTDALIIQDLGVTVLSTVLALIFVKFVTKLATEDVLQPRDSRKIIHSLSAPLFMLLWPFFSNLWGSRLFAASVPLLQSVRLLLAASNRGGDDENELAGAISRSGNEKEALGGPFIYTVILFIAIITSFKDNFIAVMALSAMAAGDGMADVFGRRFGKNNKWFFNKDKSVAGTMAFIVASSLCSIGLGFYFQAMGAIPLNALSFAELAGKFVTISIISAAIELFPIVDDNWSVPITAGISSYILLS